MIKRVIQNVASIMLLNGLCAVVPAYAAEASSVADIPAGEAIPVNLTLSNGGTVVATFTESIVSGADAILTTPASINLALDSAAAEGVEEGQSTTVTVSAVDAFANPWPRELTIPFSFDSSEATRGTPLDNEGKDFIAGDSVTIPAGAGEATANLTVKSDGVTEPGTGGNGETISLAVDGTKLKGKAVAGSNSSVDIRIIDIVIPKILSVSIPDQPHVVGDEVTATITVESNEDDFTSGEGGLSGSIAGYELADFRRNSATEYAASFSVSSDSVAEFTRAEGDKGIYLNGQPLAVEVVDSDNGRYKTALIRLDTPIAGRAVIEGYFDSETTAHDFIFTYAEDPSGSVNTRSLTSPGPEVRWLQYAGDNLDSALSTQYSSNNDPVWQRIYGGRQRINVSGVDTAYRIDIYPGEGPPVFSGADITAANDLPVSLSITSSSGGVSAPYTAAISQANDPVLVTPAEVNISLPTSGDEGTTVSGTVTAVDAFGNGWPKPLTNIGLAYTGSASNETDYSAPTTVSLSPANACQVTATGSSGEGDFRLESETAWIFGAGDTSPTLTLDLCQVQEINELEIRAGAHFAGTENFIRQGNISYSADGETFVDGGSFSMVSMVDGLILIDENGNIEAVQHFITGSASGTVNARYVRVELEDWNGASVIRIEPLNLPSGIATSAEFDIVLTSDSVTDPDETVVVSVDGASLPSTAAAGSNASATLTIVNAAPYLLQLASDHVGLVTSQPIGRIGALSVRDYTGAAEYRLLSDSDPVGADICADGADDHNSFFSTDGSNLNLADTLAGTSPVITEVRLCLAAQIATDDGVEEFAQALVLDVFETPQLTFSQTWHGYDSTLMTQPSSSIVLRDSMLNHPDFVDSTAPHPPRVPTMGSFEVTDSALDSRLSNARFTIVGPADSTRNNCVSASSTATVNAVFNRGITENTLNTPVDIDLKASPANFDACLRVVLDDSAGSIALQYEQVFSVRTVFELEQDIELADLASSLNLDSSKVRFNTLTGVFTADFGGSQASCKPVSVTDAPAGRAAGSSINDDGLLEIVTDDGKLLTCSGAVEDLEKFKEAATPQSTLAAMSVVEQVQSKEFSLSFNLACVGGDCQSLVKNDICSALALGAADCGRVIVNRVSATSNLRAPRSLASTLSSQNSQTFDVSSLSADDLLGESYFFRPSVMTLEVSSSAELGMRSLPASADSSLNTMHYVYEDDLGVRRSQEMLPVVARWDDVQESIGILAGVEDVGIDDEGVLSISGNTLTLRYLPDYEVRVYGNFTGQSSSGATIEYNSLGDINGDGRDDVEIVHSDGLRQYLFQLPQQFTDSASLSQ